MVASSVRTNPVPASWFVAEPEYAWSPPQPPRKRPAKPRTKPVRPANHEVGASTRQVMIDRLEAAIDAGRIELCPDDMPCESLDLTLNELALLLTIVLGEEYVAAERPPPPTETAPGSADRIAEYARRLARGQCLFGDKDARADGASKRGLSVRSRKNGNGTLILGWSE